MPRAFRQRITIRKGKLTTTRSTLMRHNLSYRGRLKSSNAEVAFVRANFTAGRGHAWEGAGHRDRESRQRVRLHFRPFARHTYTVELADPIYLVKRARF